MGNFGFSNRDIYFTTDDSASGPPDSWNFARRMIVKAEEMLTRVPRKPGVIWTGNGIIRNARWERFARRVEAVLAHYGSVYNGSTCPGCGEYSEDGKVHKTARCRADARCDI